MNKLPFNYVSLHVDRLYDRKFEDSNAEGINKHCEFIAEFIKASGWTEEEYFNTMIGSEPLDKPIPDDYVGIN